MKLIQIIFIKKQGFFTKLMNFIDTSQNACHCNIYLNLSNRSILMSLLHHQRRSGRGWTSNNNNIIIIVSFLTLKYSTQARIISLNEKSKCHSAWLEMQNSCMIVFPNLVHGNSKNKLVSLIRFWKATLGPKRTISPHDKRRQLQHGCRKWGTHARVFSQTLMHGNSKNEIRQRSMRGMSMERSKVGMKGSSPASHSLTNQNRSSSSSSSSSSCSIMLKMDSLHRKGAL